MKPGVRAVGVAASDGAREGDPSVLCGAVVRADRVADDFSFAACTVGGTDATTAIESIVADLDREDARYLLVSGVAPAWFNVVDLSRLADLTERPVLSVSFEESAGLEPALREAFDGDALDRRLGTYRALPPRRRVDVNDETVFVRAVGCDDDEAARLVRAFTPEGGRPEPLRVARLAARGARRWHERSG
ncbi:DUF99 family protein [Salinigranum marinum]|uniref:endonuclease dU n=1 Tax=Salinigranum marinum TaxID=1515595 RepID=UPI002989B704|nr:DUF99 family protein [Salinigranum marinum]